jgi:hypothetical protein
VGSAAEFAGAVAALADSGGTVVLAPRSYGDLVVPPRSARPLRIVGTPGARIRRLLLDRTRQVSLEDVIVSPAGGDAWVHAEGSSGIVLDGVLVTAGGTPFQASVELTGSSGVTIRNSVFTHCGDRSPAWSNCLLLGLASHVLVEDSWFHDCLGCDFVHGRWSKDLRLVRNRFERALPCRIGRVRCGHQDLVELFSGDGLLVERNRFGVYRIGGAQLYLTNSIDHVTIENNVFLGMDRLVPGYRARVGLIVGSRGFVRVPHYVKVVNNTILTGARRADGYEGSIRMSSMYGAVPRAERPLLANNVIGVLEVPGHVCSEALESVSNVVLRGKSCSASDQVGDAALDAAGRPTTDSTLLVDRADARYAPAADVTGKPRDGAPDIGAYEFR